MQRTWYLASLAVILPAASAQDRTVVPLPSSLEVAAPRPPASALDAASQLPSAAPVRTGIEGVTPIAYDAAVEDELPLPIPAQVRATPQGDVVIRAASGDPHFLGFAAGPYFPPSNERLDPLLLANVQAAYSDGRPAQETYGFVMYDKRITPARTKLLEQLGARVIEFHPYNCLKVALPIFALDSIAALPDVRWVGVARPQQKVHPRLVELLARNEANRGFEVYVNVFDSDLNGASVVETFGSVGVVDRGAVREGDPSALPKRTQSNGWQQRQLQELGVEVLDYVEPIRAFRARIVPAQLEGLIALDFVQFVEGNEAAELDHDFSTPLVSTDVTRPYASGGTNLVVTAGQVDSGFDAGHWDLNHTNGVGWDFTGSATGPWYDGCTHGSHVAGTVLGNGGSGSYELIGNAPGLGWGGSGRYYNIKHFNDGCLFSGAGLSSVVGLLHTSFFDGVSTTQRPMVINNSWGTDPGGGTWIGTEADARLLDDEVYFYVQDYVFSSGNYGPGKVGLQAGSKNVITVGNVQPYGGSGYGSIGDLAWDSSTGPMGDGRWKPNVCAPGANILSVAANTTNGHSYKWGTSMAAPHVTGVIAQLTDAYPFLRYAPARTDSLVMASAVTRNNQVLTTPADAHLRQFGTGRVDAYKSLYGTGDSGWVNWGFYMSSNTYSYADFTVNPGCTRLVVVMHYAESQASSGASKALKNNWDLYLDAAPIDPNFNTGDYFAQQSSVDNTEIRILDNPTTGAWRWKTWPTSTTTGCDMGVTVYAFYGSTTPDLTVTTTQDKYYAKPGESVDFTGWIYNPGSLAAGVGIEPNLDGGSLWDSLRSLGDGNVAHYMDNFPSYGFNVTLGDMLPGTWKGNIWRTQWFSEGIKNLTVTSTSDNAIDHVAAAWVTVDGTAPSDVTGLSSSSHPPFTWINAGDVFTTWNAASDGLSGIAGYSLELTPSGGTFPDEVVDTLTPDFAFYGIPSSDASGYYVSVRAVDMAGNGSANPAIYGPIFVDVDVPTDPSNLSSSSHTPGVGSCSSVISVQWTDGDDLHSGVQGYAFVFDNSPSTDMTGAPVTSIGVGNTQYNEDVGASAAEWYFHVATVDWAGNYSATVTDGPYLTSVAPQNHCTGKLNSLGCLPSMGWNGVASASATSGFTVNASDVRNKKSGLLFYGINGSANQPFQGGSLCVKAPIKRTSSVNSGGSPTGDDCTGVYQIDMNAFASGLAGGTPIPALKIPGTTVDCQWWGRDPGYPAPNNTTLSDGLTYVVCN